MLAHEKDAVSKRHSHGGWEAFWDGDNQDNDSNGEAVDQLLCKDFTANIIIDSNLHEKNDQRSSEDDKGSDNGNEFETLANNSELFAEISSLVSSVILGVVNSTSGELTNSAYNSSSGTSEDKGISVEEGLLLISDDSPPANLGRSILLVFAADLLDMKVVRLEYETISRDLVTRFELNDVTNYEVPDRLSLKRASLSSQDGESLVSILALEFNELRVLAVVIESSDKNLDEKSDEDEDTFNPARFWLNDHSRNDTEDSE